MTLENTDIKLKPQFIYWLGKNLFPLCLTIGIIIMGICLQPLDTYINIIIVVGAIMLIGAIFFNYIKLLLCTSWVITEEQIRIDEGVFTKNINYMEMYRIVDYEEKQTIWQRIFHNTTLYIYSTDKSHPKLAITGIKKDQSIMQEIRDRVETQRKIKNVRELSNL